MDSIKKYHFFACAKSVEVSVIEAVAIANDDAEEYTFALSLFYKNGEGNTKSDAKGNAKDDAKSNAMAGNTLGFLVTQDDVYHTQ